MTNEISTCRSDPNPALKSETAPDSTTPNSQPFVTSNSPSTPAEPMPSIPMPNDTIEQTPIVPLTVGLTLPPPAPNPFHVPKPDQTSSLPIQCSNCLCHVPTQWGYDVETRYQIVTGLCALVAMIHKACTFITHAATDDDTFMFDYQDPLAFQATI